MFRNANVVVTGGQFTQIDNGLDYVSTILLNQVVEEAIFDHGVRYSKGKCHPGTREKMINKITTMINNPTPDQRIVHVYGPAGNGKSALAHTICDILVTSHPERYGGSFFFSRGSTDRGNGYKLFTTLSYQLAIHFPSMRTEINAVLYQDPSLPTKSMEVQLSSLIVQPLLRCQTHLSHSPIIIIDGLDECADTAAQYSIVDLIANCVVEHKLPLRFMIASRPEYWIREAFKTWPLPKITMPLSLRNDFDADKDIKMYLTDGFEKIRVEQKRVMRSVMRPWPPTDIVHRFVYEASGQFIYASTILKFVGQFFSDPQEQLRIITGPNRASAFSGSELDGLYKTILSSYPRWETMKRTLGGLLVGANTTILKAVLNVEPNELVLVLDALSSLIDIKKPKALSKDELVLQSIFGSLLAGRDRISFCHLSFQEFLEDETRSGEFYIDIDAVRYEIVQAFFSMIHRNLDQQYEYEPHVVLNIDLATYHDIMRSVAFTSIQHCGVESLLPFFTHTTQKLLLLDHSRGMNYLSCFMGDMSLLESVSSSAVLYHPSSGSVMYHPDPEHTKAAKSLGKLIVASYNLERAVKQARDNALAAMPLCSKFKVTSTLVYLTEYHTRGEWLSINHLSTIPAITDVTSTVRQHRHVIRLSYRHLLGYEQWSLEHVNLNSLFDDVRDTGLCFLAEWKDQRIVLAHHYLNSILNHHTSDVVVKYACHILKERFYDIRNISDICTKETSSNMCKCLVMLESMVDLASWTKLLNNHLPSLGHFLLSVLCWFNRQLTNVQSIKLLQDHDENIYWRMTTTMKHLFEFGFLPIFTESYDTQLCAMNRGGLNRGSHRSVTIKVLPLPQGFYYQEDESSGSAPESQYSDYWRTFHDEIFGKVLDDSVDGSNAFSQIIHHSSWHPSLASRLLNAFVKYLYGRIYPIFLESFRIFEESLPYITQCLPYAQTTPENLEALRAIVYLYPQVAPRLLMPEGFWSSSVQFLQKYDRSILSLEELQFFESWLYSPDHSDIRGHAPGKILAILGNP